EPVVLERHLVGRASTAVKVLSSAARNGAANAAKGKRLTDDHRNSPARDVGARLLPRRLLAQPVGRQRPFRYAPAEREGLQCHARHEAHVVFLAPHAESGSHRTHPGFHLTMIVCSTSQASLADNGGSAQIQIFAATSIKSKVKNALKGVFSDRPIWNALVGGNAQDPFILQTPYVWERRTPVLVVMQNRATAQNTVNFALHGMRPHS